jgi:hypothetical protein
MWCKGSFAIQRERLKTILVEKQEKLTLVGSKKKLIEWRMWRHHGDRNICLAMFLVSLALRSLS